MVQVDRENVGHLHVELRGPQRRIRALCRTGQELHQVGIFSLGREHGCEAVCELPTAGFEFQSLSQVCHSALDVVRLQAQLSALLIARERQLAVVGDLGLAPSGFPDGVGVAREASHSSEPAHGRQARRVETERGAVGAQSVGIPLLLERHGHAAQAARLELRVIQDRRQLRERPEHPLAVSASSRQLRQGLQRLFVVLRELEQAPICRLGLNESPDWCSIRAS